MMPTVRHLFVNHQFSDGNPDGCNSVSEVEFNCDLVVSDELPAKLNLLEVYPNPFSVFVTFNFGLSQAHHVTLRIYDSRGQAVATLVDAFMSTEEHKVTWDASNMASGIYLYRIEVGNYATDGKLVYLP